MWRVLTVSLLSASLLAAIPAAAQLAPDAAFMAYMKTEPYKRLMAQAMARVSPIVAPKCAKQVLGETAVTPLVPVPFGPDGQPTGGGWKQTTPVRGCGNDTALNFQFFVGAEKRIITLVTTPGTTHTDLQQQRDAFAQAVIGLDGPSKGCRELTVLDAKFIQYGVRTPPMADPGPGAVFRLWEETWTVLGCGKRWEVPLNFIPNRTGTQIVVGGQIVAK